MQPRIIKNYVAGQFVTSQNTFDDFNPVDGSVVGIVHEADRTAVHAAGNTFVAYKPASRNEENQNGYTSNVKGI